MQREMMVQRMADRREPWDMVIVGGGATGAGIAVDAASRGYEVLLVERSDFGAGTSSRSTKLVHGGVRYLGQGNVSLVMEALKERGVLRRNAPHLVKDLAFVVPSYEWWESPFYGLGLKLYNQLSGKYRFGPTRRLSKEETLEMLPSIRTEGLRGGVIYYDGQFDDSRLLINLLTTAAEQGATVVNYADVTALSLDAEGLVNGVTVRDKESGRELPLAARVVINATGAFCDGLRQMADPSARAMVAPSQGSHLVFDGTFLRADSAIMVPHTTDGRVMFAIPWHGHTLVGTTDVPLDHPPIEPRATDDEVDFILDTASRYLERRPTRADILSVFAGIRPLVRASDSTNTAALSRDHTIHIDQSGLVTIAGGKWTTYRNMAEDCVNQAATLAGLEERPAVTRNLNIHGFHQHADRFGSLALYGSDAPAIENLVHGDPSLGSALHQSLPYVEAEVVWAVREEMARSIEDVLGRRMRALFLNARAALAMAPRVAALMAAELRRDDAWQAAQLDVFRTVAAGYLVE